MRLIENWASVIWRAWSTRLAIVAGVLAGFVTANPGAIGQLVAYVPDPWRPLASFGAAVFVWAVPTLARLIKQGGDHA